MFQRLYIIRFSFLLTILQSALVVYLSVVLGINDGEFYGKFFQYSLILALVPIIFAVISFGFTNQGPTSYTDQANGFVNSLPNSSIEHKNVKIHDTEIYLFALGFIFMIYTLIFRLLSLPYWIVFICPMFLSIPILSNDKRF